MTVMNNTPVLAIALPHQSSAEDEDVSFALPENAFTDLDGDTLTLSATLADGAALPGWLVFDAVAGSFSGTPPQNYNGIVNVMVTASDGSLSASDVFALEITSVNDAPVTLNDIVGTSEFRVNEFTHSSQVYPSVTALANGHFVVTWESNGGQQGDTSESAIKARIFDENGDEIVSEFLVNEFTNGVQSWPSVTALTNGHFVITWQSDDAQQDDTSSTAIKASIFDENGVEIVSEFVVNEFTDGPQRLPSVTALTDGQFAVSWESLDQQQGDTDWAIKASIFDATGSEIVSEFLVNEFTNGAQHDPSITALTNGHFVVTWASWDQQQGDTSSTAIKARILDTDGNEIVTEFRINEFTNSAQTNPSVTALADGNFVVTWMSNDGQQGDASGGGIKASIFDANGDAIASEFLVNEYTTHYQSYPSVTTLANGHFVVTWASKGSQQGDDDYAIKARIFDATGNEIVSEFLVNEVTHGPQWDPSVTALADGGFVITWESGDRQQGDASSAIQARIFDANGVAQNPDPITEDAVALIEIATLLGNDSDVDGDVLTMTAVDATSAHDATLMLNTNGTISYDPTGAADVQALAEGETLTDTFTYTVKDGHGGESTTSVSVIVHGTNDAPVVSVPLPDQSSAEDEAVAFALPANAFTDVDGDALTLSATLTDGTALPGWLEFDAASGSFSGTPPQDFHGTLSVTVTASDGSLSESGIFALEITPVNDAPVAADDVVQSSTLVTEDVVTSIDIAALLANDSDVDGDVLAVTAVDATSAHGAALELHTDGTISYDPTNADAVQALTVGQTLIDTFTYVTNDGNGGVSVATVSLVVHGTNDAPVLAIVLPDQSSAEDEAMSFVLPANAFTDVDGDTLTLSATLVGGAALPDWLVFDAAAGSFSGTPPKDYTGQVSVIVTASDGALSESGIFALEITAVNDAPVAADDVAQSSTLITEDVVTPIAIATLLSNDSDIDGDVLAVTAVDATSAHGATLKLNSDGTISYDPTGVDGIRALAEGETLTDTFTYTVKDGHGGESTASVSVVVHGTNAAPVAATALPNQTSAEDEAVSFVLPANVFTDVDGDALTLSATLAGGAALPGWLVFDAAAGSFSGTPPQDYTGQISVTVMASDGSLSESSTFVLEITPVNDAPAADDDFVFQSSTPITEDVVTSIDIAALLSNDSDVDGDAFTVTAVDATSAHGATLKLNTNGTISYDPTGAAAAQALAEGQTLIDTFTYTIEDGHGGEDTATVYVVVRGTNDAPIVVNDTAQTATPVIEDAVALIDAAMLLANDSDVEGDALTMIAVSDMSTHGATLKLNANGTISYDPTGADAVQALANGQALTDTFTYTVADGKGGESTASVSIVVFGTNDAPVAADDVVQSATPITEDGVTLIDIATLLANDSDVEGDALTVSEVSALSAHDAALTLNSDGTISYDPTGADAVQALAEGQTLTDTFTYRVKDGSGGESTATVSVVVHGTNDAPVLAIALPDQSSAEDEAVSFALPANAFTDVDGDALTLSATLTDGTALPDWLEFDAVAGRFSGIPPQDYTGQVSVIVMASDGSLSTSGTFALEITPVNDAPAVADDVAQSSTPVTEDVVTPIATAILLANDSDVEGDALTMTAVDARSAHGATLVLNTNGTISYDPTSAAAVQALTDGQTLTDTFTYTVEDGNGGESTATVSIIVHGTNDAPVLAIALPNQSSAEDEAVSFALPANAFTDVEGDALTLNATLAGGAALPDWLVFDAVAGSFSGTPPQDFDGILSVTVTASDGSLSESGTFALEITPVNDAPAVADDIVIQSSPPITEDVVTSIDIATLLANDSDADGDVLTMTAVDATSAHDATLTLNTDGTISYDPTGAAAVQALAEGQTLVDTFTYTVEDGHGGENTATVYVVVRGTNDAPVLALALEDQSSAEDEAVSFALPANAFTDVDGDALTLSATLTDGTALPDWLVFDAVAGSFSGSPPQDFNGMLSVTVTASDGSLSASDTFALEITPVNDAPVAADDVAQSPTPVTEDVVTSIDIAALLANDSDVDGDVLAVTAVDATSAHGAALELHTDGTISYDPTNADAVQALAVGQTLTDTFTYTIEDGHGGENTATVSIVVHGANDAPVATYDSEVESTLDAENTIDASEFHVNDLINSAQNGPGVAELANGNIVEIWTEEYGPPAFDVTAPHVKARIVDADGVEIVSEFYVIKVFGVQTARSVIALSNGNFIVTWGHSDNSDPVTNARVFDANGVAISSTLNVAGLSFLGTSSVTELANGNFVASWSNAYFNDVTGYDSYVRVFDANGDDISGLLQVNAPLNARDWFDVSVTALANGNFVVTWNADDPQDGSYSYATKARIYDANGVGVTDEFLVNSNTDGAQWDSSVTALTNGDFVVTWESEARIFDANGVAKNPDIIIEDFVTLIETANLLANDSDVDGDALTVTAVSATSAHGAALMLNPNGTISYNPTNADAVQALAEGQTLTDTFTYTVKDGNGGESTAIVSIVVHGANDAPVVAEDFVTHGAGLVTEDVVTLIDTTTLLANDGDVEGDALTVTEVSATSAHGAALMLNPNGTISYDPTNADAIQALGVGQPLTDTFTYTVKDGNGGESVATVSIEVLGLSETPMVVGTDVNDTLYGSIFLNDNLYGGDGNDELWGGRDLGYDGDDYLSGGDGDDKLFGDFDQIPFTPGDDILDGGNGNDSLYGRRGDDILHGGGGDDYLRGGDGDDVLYGGDGDDSLDGGGGSDTLYGGDGDDFMDGGGGGNDTLYGGDGNDTLLGSYENSHLHGGNGNDILYGGFFDLSDSGDDTLEGGAGDDTLYGVDGDDILQGGEGDDLLYGDDDNDTLAGDAGNDTLTGGSGDDTFVFDPGFGKDIITDFAAGAATDDVVEFRGITNLVSYTDVLNSAADDGTDTTIMLDTDNSIVLKNVVISDLSSDDFRFYA
ncbi:tandem-95 repeat protein [Cognatiyoonia sp. IB215182]|uniref:tandem-95 repeat protein n=1 Tax=Cognatiyoonia sp. IB215182 TaxID=3097353 RepID=UPI002A128ED5|nr:tandem-95 repeat protein [Cognatiyoonia sp. IB215182]MDX8355765.1 tandem-95 repeat protein [Cognatiyoonia sp. IB215182]